MSMMNLLSHRYISITGCFCNLEQLHYVLCCIMGLGVFKAVAAIWNTAKEKRSKNGAIKLRERSP